MASTNEILDSLAERSTRNITDYADARPAPKGAVPGKLALCLDDLLDSATEKLGLERDAALAQVLEHGVVTWYRCLTEADREKIGLAGFGFAPEGNCKEAKDQLKLKLAENNQYEDDLDSDDPNPAAAQQQADAYAYQNSAYGYTPMTIHSLSETKNGRQGQGQGQKSNNRQSSKKRRPFPESRKKKNRGRKRG